jgi:hypothetical protein
LARIDKLKQQVEAVQTVADAHRPVHHGTLEPLRTRHAEAMRDMARWLDGRLQRKGLSASQKKMATRILCNLSETLALGGDESMKALHDKHSAQSLRDKEQAAIDAMNALMEDNLGITLDEGDLSPESLDEALHIGMERLRQAAAEEQAKQRTKPRRKPSAAQRKAEQHQQDADTMLRKLFRQLASALHPDRETDPEARASKTALMSEANAANARRDLVALLHIQLRLAQTDPQSLPQMAEDKLAPMSVLLKAQIGDLETELRTREDQARHEFGMSPFDTFSAVSLRRHLAHEALGLEQELSIMEQDLRDVQDDAAFKLWLREQKSLLDEAAMMEEWDVFDPFSDGRGFPY